MAHERWSIIDKHYRAWLAGQEAPVDGTPLAAWNALTPEQADVLRANSIKTVEDVAALTDTHIARLPLPNMRELIRQARHFIDAAEQTRFAASLAAKEREIESLKAENAERDAQIAALMQKVDELAAGVAARSDDASDGEPEKRGARARKSAA
jgi:hypothetical protein